MSEMDPYSDAANERQRLIEEKKARGEKVGWSDLVGIFEPNPDLPDCPSHDIDSGAACTLPHHHEGRHKAEIEW